MRRLLKVIRWICIAAVSFPLLWIVTSYAVYRIPSGDERNFFDGEVHYKFVELNFTNRQLFEEVFANRILRLQGHPILYVSETDHAKFWSENPHRMSAAGYTFRARLAADPLLFGGHSLARVMSVERIEKEPIIRK